MTQDSEYLGKLMNEIANVYADGYREQKARALETLDDLESPAGRQALSESNPE